MKKNILLISFSLVLSNCYGQAFTLIASDPSGDLLQTFVPDIQSLYYSIDTGQDSLQFRIHAYNAIDPHGDVGLMFGFDTNMVVTDGINWNGANHSMKYDVAFIIFQDVGSPGYYGISYGSSGSAQVPTIVERTDSFTYVIRTRLSNFDHDGHFNLLFGSGPFDIASNRTVYDDVPNSGFMTISGATGISETNGLSDKLIVFPNPSAGYISVSNIRNGFKDYVIFSSSGEQVQEGSFKNDERIPVQNLKPGNYFLQFTGEGEKIQRARFIKADQ